MHNECATKKGRVAPQPQDRRAIRATRFSRVAFSGLLAICMLAIGFTVRAQDPSGPAAGPLHDFYENLLAKGRKHPRWPA